MKNISEEQLTELRQYGIKIESEEEFQSIKNRLEKVGEVVDDPYTQCSTERPYLVFGNVIDEWFFSNPSDIDTDTDGIGSSVYDTKEFITSDVFKAIYTDMESEDGTDRVVKALGGSKNQRALMGYPGGLGLKIINGDQPLTLEEITAPDTTVKSLLSKYRAFTEELEALSSKHGLWIIQKAEGVDLEEDRGNCYDDYAEMFRVDQMESGGIEK